MAVKITRNNIREARQTIADAISFYCEQEGSEVNIPKKADLAEWIMMKLEMMADKVEV